VQIRRGATEEQIEQVYRARFHEFSSVANAILRDREEAIDAVQDAVASALANKGQWRRRGSLDAWLWRAVINAAHDRRRKRRRSVANATIGDGRAAQDQAAREGGAIADAVAALPERQRVVVFLRYYGDLDYRRIAMILGLKEGTVAATLHQAQHALRRGLEVRS
jgi:RNA polymerase sigma-70 factor, ECF subfamily